MERSSFGGEQESRNCSHHGPPQYQQSTSDGQHQTRLLSISGCCAQAMKRMAPDNDCITKAAASSKRRRHERKHASSSNGSDDSRQEADESSRISMSPSQNEPGMDCEDDHDETFAKSSSNGGETRYSSHVGALAKAVSMENAASSTDSSCAAKREQECGVVAQSDASEAASATIVLNASLTNIPTGYKVELTSQEVDGDLPMSLTNGGMDRSRNLLKAAIDRRQHGLHPPKKKKNRRRDGSRQPL